MPYEVTWEKRGVHRRYFGVLTQAEFLESRALVSGDERFDTLRYVINDFLDITDYQFDPGTLRKLAAVDQAAALTNPHINIAIVTRDERVRELARQYRAGVKGRGELGLFETLEEARAWGRGFLSCG